MILPVKIQEGILRGARVYVDKLAAFAPDDLKTIVRHHGIVLISAA
jgi:hypothetical protein